jgi:hypothetical protein
MLRIRVEPVTPASDRFAVEHNAQKLNIACYTASAHKRAIVAADP